MTADSHRTAGDHARTLAISAFLMTNVLNLPGMALGQAASAPSPPTASAPADAGKTSAPAVKTQVYPTIETLMIGPMPRNARSVLAADPMAAVLGWGEFETPAVDATLSVPPVGEKKKHFRGLKDAKWTVARRDESGAFKGGPLAGGYLCARVAVKQPGVAILHAVGHGMVYVNGVPRPGDPYQTGYVRTPIELTAPETSLLFQVARGSLTFDLDSPRAEAQMETADSTLPDFVVGRDDAPWAATVLLNCTTAPRAGLALKATLDEQESATTPVPTLLPLGVRKIGFRLPRRKYAAAGTAKLHLELLDTAASPPRRLDAQDLTLRIRTPQDSRKETFISDTDGSVQYYAVRPAIPGAAGEAAPPPALVLSLHGASVEATSQADAYSSKSWLHLVCPTNRRPFGFDWEDWGRLDALEVLRLAQSQLHHDPQRVYLTGHSMGGHGTWQLGALYPGRFAAIAPSAGWPSMYGYAGAPRAESDDAPQALFDRAAATSDTYAMLRNYADTGIYILHGDADDNVPVDQAREMLGRLKGFHHDYQVHEQPGAGHWWDASDEPGADCVDWPPLFAFLARHVLPPADAVRDVDFTTVSPGASATCHWATIVAQEQPMKTSRVRLHRDFGLRKITGKVDNVRRLSLDVSGFPPGKPIAVEIEGSPAITVDWPKLGTTIHLDRAGNAFAPVAEFPRGDKNPRRNGLFKDAYRNRVLLVYGTQGNDAQRSWALAKARYDAEVFGYRGNGSFDVIPDTAFDPAAEPDRNIVLYGNADTNRAWDALLKDSPVQLHTTRVNIGDKRYDSSTLACLMIRPRPGSDVASVGVVGGTGEIGMRLTDRLPVFISGVGLPDFAILGYDDIARGRWTVHQAGFFGIDWGLKGGVVAIPASAAEPAASSPTAK